LISKLTWVDYLAVIAVLRGAYVGYKAGLFPEILRIVAYLVTVIVTLRFHEALAQLLTLNTFLNAATANAVAFGALLLVTFVLCKLAQMLVLKLLKMGDGGVINKLLGLLLGACRWLIILSLAFMLIEFSPLTTLKTDIRERSVSGPRIASVAPTIFQFLSSLSPQLAVNEETPKKAKKV